MAFGAVRSFTLELDGPRDAVYNSGEVVSGQVVLVLHRASKVRSMKVLGRGVATAHWLENRTVGMNSVYNDYTSKITYFRKRQHLIRGGDGGPDYTSTPDGPVVGGVQLSVAESRCETTGGGREHSNLSGEKSVNNLCF